MKVSELRGFQLDYWVGKAEGLDVCIYCGATFISREFDDYAPSESWELAGPIIEREKIAIAMLSGQWRAYTVETDSWGNGNDPSYWLLEVVAEQANGNGETPIIAAMRAYVRSKFGDEVEPGIDIESGAQEGKAP